MLSWMFSLCGIEHYGDQLECGDVVKDWMNHDLLNVSKGAADAGLN